MLEFIPIMKKKQSKKCFCSQVEAKLGYVWSGWSVFASGHVKGLKNKTVQNLKLSFAGTKGLSLVADKQPHTIILPPTNFTQLVPATNTKPDLAVGLPEVWFITTEKASASDSKSGVL